MAVTPVTSVPEFCSALGRSKLVDESQVVAIRQKWLAGPNRSDADVNGFRKFLVQEKILTDYQAALIQRGRVGGFFVGDYVIVDRVGSGQTAGVYKAVHKFGQVVAIKVMAGSKAKDENTLNRFQREGRLLTQLDHPNAVRAYQLGQIGEVHFIVMEYLEGETLDAVLERRKKLPAGEAVRLIHQTLLGLQHVHEKRMIHRDVKPANLMLVPPNKADTLSSTVKILDIGLGRELFDEARPSTHDLNLTGEGAILGTPDYLAPEQARSARTADIRADLYSVGCVLYHVLTGQPPFHEKNVMTQVVKHATETPKSVSELQPDVPKELSKVIAKLMEKKPEDRPQTPREAAELLKPFLPVNGSVAESSPVLPAYREWLESESGFEIPKPVSALKPAAPTPQPAAKTIVASTKPGSPKAIQPVVPAVKAPAPAKPVVPQKAATPVPMPVPVPVPDYTINVELVLQPDEDDDDGHDDEAGLFPHHRRDWLMLGGGGLLMLAAAATGFGLTTLFRSKLAEPKE
jgi:eukaryotic-like serine/threonine-protein kinase